VGRSIASSDWRAPLVARELESLTSSAAVRHRCSAIAREIAAADPVRQTCELIESVL
jgi:hypothetical protein